MADSLSFFPKIAFAPLDASRGASSYSLSAEWEAEDDWSPIDDADFGGPEGAEEGRVAARLDNNRVSLHPPTPKKAKSAKKITAYGDYTERTKARFLHFEAGAKGASKCGIRTLDGRADLVRDIVRKGPEAGKLKAKILNVFRCSSPWLCPVCGPRISIKRAEDLAPQVDKLIEAGWTAWLITLTARHSKKDKLKDSFSLFQEAWGRMTSGKAINKKRAAMGGLEYVRGYDLTYGRNGWHLHFHLVLLVGPYGGTGEKTADWLLQKWETAIENSGGKVLKRALDKRPAGNAAAAAAYAMSLAGVAKHKDKEAAQKRVAYSKISKGFSSIAEATAAAAKRGRDKGGRTAADIRQAAIAAVEEVERLEARRDAAKASNDLKEAEWCEERIAEVGRLGDKDAALYKEFAQATLGKRAVVVSQGLRLKSEEEAAEEEEIVMPEVVGYLREQGLVIIDKDIGRVLTDAQASVEKGRETLEALLGEPGLDGLWRVPTEEEEETDWAALRKEAEEFDAKVRKRRADESAKIRQARRKRMAARKTG